MRTKFKGRAHGRSPAPGAGDFGRRPGRGVRLTLALVLAAGIGVTAWAWRRPAQPPTAAPGASSAPTAAILREPPPLDLAGVAEPDPAVVQTIEAARERVRASPDSSQAWGQLGMLLRAHGADPEAAKVCFEQAERIDPNEPRWPYFQGLAMALTDAEGAMPKLARAADLCDAGRVGSTAPDAPPDAPRVKLAEALLALGRREEAESQFRRLLVTGTDHPRAHLGLGRLAYLGDTSSAAAERHLATAAASPFARKAAGLLLAELFHAQGDAARAAQQLAAAGRLPEDQPWPDPFEVEVERTQVGRKRSLSVAMALMREGRTREAIAVLREALRQYPDSERVMMLLGLAHNLEKDWPAGEQVLREAAARSPAAPRVQYHLGLALLSQGKHGEAAESFARAASSDPTSADTHYQLGLCRTQLADRAGAVAAFRTALSCKPDHAAAHRHLGQLLAGEGRRADALEHLRHAVRLNPADPEARRLLAELQNQTRRDASPRPPAATAPD